MINPVNLDNDTNLRLHNEDLIDPSVPQREASSPDASVWVGASAGSGKTKVLTDRIIRLLLPRKNGTEGTLPHKILSITFTKAGASEMLLRVNQILSGWCILSEQDLNDELESLLGHRASEMQTLEARKLFAKVIDSPGGLKIMTIHSFCQSILGRFPLEANIPPNFDIIEDGQAFKILTNAKDSVLLNDSDCGKIRGSVKKLSFILNEQQFLESIEKNIISERRQLKKFIKEYENKDDLLNSYRNMFSIPKEINSELDLQQYFVRKINYSKADLYILIEALLNGGKKDQDRGINIKGWIESDNDFQLENFDFIKSQFIKKTDNSPYKLSAKTIKFSEEASEIYIRISDDILNLLELRSSFLLIEYTMSLLNIGTAILDIYDNYKKHNALLDFDDIIHTTLDLLKGDTLSNEIKNTAAWVLYKLDGGIDHILVDEAQDTNPEQWEIVKILSDEFFASSDNDNKNRTIFIVGDEKQSIYSFQRANPKIFYDMKKYFEKKVQESSNIWKDIYMNTSFRSTKVVLDIVDKSINSNNLGQSVGLAPSSKLRHVSFNDHRAGLVELWPLVKPETSDDKFEWFIPDKIVAPKNAKSVLAGNIATSIKGWLDNKELLVSKNRPIEPGDIMILVRSRNSLVNMIMRELKNKSIPVSGSDRMIISEEIVIEDLIAAASFALLPDDDYNLACLLKSPLINFTEDQLMEIAIDRGNRTLWQALKSKDNKDLVEYLSNLIEKASKDHPYEFFNSILNLFCPASVKTSGLQSFINRLGNDAVDPIYEFLNLSLEFEVDNIATLQGFVCWHHKSNHVIKREMDEGKDSVRIMTVHGSKGLQSSIVIMPDTIPSNRDKTTNFIWPDKSGYELPIWAVNKSHSCKMFDSAKEKIQKEEYDEYVRLMYVAMTRAEDRLYVCGYQRKRGDKFEGSWYQNIKNGFVSCEDYEEIDVYWDNENEDKIIRISCDQEIDVDLAKKETDVTVELNEYSVDNWVYEEAPVEPSPPRVLSPSRLDSDDDPVLSPLSVNEFNKDNRKRFMRGNIIHKLLEILPEIDENKRLDIAKKYVSKKSFELSIEQQEDIINETMVVINDQSFSLVFSTNSRAEIPITAMIGKHIISGSIDRMIILDDEVMIVDYKTNRPSPSLEEDIPVQYIKQLKSYRDVIKDIYPNKNIKCALLWTDRPFLMHVKSLDIDSSVELSSNEA